MKKILSLLCLVYFLSGYSQDETIDSLIHSLKTVKNDTAKFNLLVLLSENCDEKDILKYAESAVDLADLILKKTKKLSAAQRKSILNKKAIALGDVGFAYNNLSEFAIGLKCYEESKKIYEEIGDQKNVASVLDNMAHIYNSLGDNIKAMDCYQQTLKINQQIGNKRGIARSFDGMGVIYNTQGNIISALEYHSKSLKIQEEIGNKDGIGTALNNIAVIFDNQGNYKTALQYYEKSLKIQEELNDKLGIAGLLNNIGYIYFRQHNISEALKFYTKSLKIQEEIGHKVGIATSLNNIGAIYRSINQLDKALSYCLKSLKIRKEIHDKMDIANSLNNAGELYFLISQKGQTINRQKLMLAYAYCDSSLFLSKKFGYTQSIRNAEESLSQIDSVKGNFTGAYYHYQQFIVYRDSINNIETKTSALKKEFEYEVEKKETEKKVLVQQNEIQLLQINQNKFFTAGLGGLLLIVLLITYILLKQNKLRNEQREAQLEQKLLRSQMNPHFIFNSLQAIQNYILKNEQKEAVKYLSSFASITRAVLENSRMELIPVKKEVSLLENYLQLQKLRFGARFDYAVHVDETIDIENTLIPPMLSQPFIENALEHGMKDLESGGLIDVYMTAKGNALLLEIKDNGKGLEQGQVKDAEHQSLATSITRERIALMNKKRTEKIIFSISEAYPNELSRGVKVSFNIPLQHLTL